MNFIKFSQTDICVEHPWKSAYTKFDYATHSCTTLKRWLNVLLTS